MIATMGDLGGITDTRAGLLITAPAYSVQSSLKFLLLRRVLEKKYQ
jgi:hypothetical protein